MNTTPDTAAALASLRDCWADLVAADAHAVAAIENLTGARRARAEELHELLADVYVHCRRLTMIVEGDLRAEGTRDPKTDWDTLHHLSDSLASAEAKLFIEVVPGLVDVEVAVPRSRPAVW
jgi:hypothetical protein